MSIFTKISDLFTRLNFKLRPTIAKRSIIELAESISSLCTMTDKFVRAGAYPHIVQAILFASEESMKIRVFYAPAIQNYNNNPYRNKSDFTIQELEQNWKTTFAMYKAAEPFTSAHNTPEGTAARMYCKQILPSIPSNKVRDEKACVFYSVMKIIEMIDDDVDALSKKIKPILDKYSNNEITWDQVDMILITVVGYLNNAQRFMTWVNTFLMVLLDPDNLPFQSIILKDSDKRVANFINAMLSRPNNSSIVAVIDALGKTGENTLITDIEDDSKFIEQAKALGIYSTEFMENKNGFVVDAVTMGIGRIAIQLRQHFYERNVDYRNWMIAKLEQLELEKDRSANQAQIDRLQKICDNYSNRITKVNKKIKDYEDAIQS